MFGLSQGDVCYRSFHFAGHGPGYVRASVSPYDKAQFLPILALSLQMLCSHRQPVMLQPGRGGMHTWRCEGGPESVCRSHMQHRSNILGCFSSMFTDAAMTLIN